MGRGMWAEARCCIPVSSTLQSACGNGGLGGTRQVLERYILSGHPCTWVVTHDSTTDRTDVGAPVGCDGCFSTAGVACRQSRETAFTDNVCMGEARRQSASFHLILARLDSCLAPCGTGRKCIETVGGWW